MKIHLKMAIFVVCFYGMQTRAVEGVYKGTSLNAEDWISKGELAQALNKNIGVYNGLSVYEHLTAASKIALNTMNEQKTAGQFGYYIIQPNQPAEFPWKKLALAGIPVTGLLCFFLGCMSKN